MAVYKCKMCGASLDIAENKSIVTCEFCGTCQTVHSFDDEKKVTYFRRANALRYKNEFDKASGIYETLVTEFPKEAEAYWGLVLCKYGIEYVDDPKTGYKIPTCHRTQLASIFDDADYLNAIKFSDSVAKDIYKKEAKAIDEIQKNIINVSSKEEPFDIFICYKETEENGERTKDSVLAQDIYKELTSEGYKVFFARITLENKLGSQYEPYIYAALHSAKVMLHVTTSAEHSDAIWVRNEWSRYISLINKGEKKTLIPCYNNMSAYDLPEEMESLQGQDMGKIGAIQDLVRGINKIMGKDEMPRTKVETNIIQSNVNVSALLKRAEILIGDRDFLKADELLERALDNDPTNSQAYLLKLLVELKLTSFEQLKTLDNPIEENGNFKKAYDFGDAQQKARLSSINEFIINRNKEARLNKLYNSAMELKNSERYDEAEAAFSEISDYKDSSKQALECANLGIENKYTKAIKFKESGMFDEAAAMFTDVIKFKDSSFQINECKRLKSLAEKEAIYSTCVFEREINPEIDSQVLKKACEKLATIPGYKDADELLARYQCILKDFEIELARIKEEAKIAKAKKVKKIKKISLISGAASLTLTGILLLTFLFLIPSGRQTNIQKLIDSGKYYEALSLIQENGNFGDTQNLESMCKAGIAFQNRDYETGIDYIYKIGGSVDVNYDDRGGNPEKEHETIKRSKNYIYNKSTKNGYDFLDWALMNYTIDSKSHHASIDLRARYSLVIYRITYNKNGGTPVAQLPTTYTVLETTVIPGLTKTGYTFLGWYDGNGNKVTSIEAGTTGDLTLTAHWSAKLNNLSVTSEDTSKGTVSITSGSGHSN